ncbi:hypothetical protein AB1Y20_016602 [Prymnesium parvum]|uniref:Ammonium transporter AmtB-like domain-containing protein n=1 Tax=Prymnesium parvum TaxID=97485 RepID=A0AB34IDW1_PRYPA
MSLLVASCAQNLTCLSVQLARLERWQAAADAADVLDTAWILSCGALVFLMQLGFAMLEAGSVREQSVLATYMKNLLDLVLGYYIAYGVHPLGLGVVDAAFHHRSFFFYNMFQSAATTIVSGAMAERTSISGYSLVALLISGCVYALAVRLTWAGGWLQQGGYHDFAGSGVVHTLGGAAALVGAAVVGPRRDRWSPGSHTLFAPHSVPSVLSGTLVLWVGWCGFNAGSTNAMRSAADAATASHAAMLTMLGASAGGAAALCLSLAKAACGGATGHDVIFLGNGLLAGLVSITAGCDVIAPGWAVLVGAGGALAYERGVAARTRLQVDDIVDAFAVHCCAGLWGVLAVGLFHAEKGLLLGGGAELLGWQLLGAAVMLLLGGVPMAALSLCLRRLRLLRVSDDDEAHGIDHAFGIGAYGQTDVVLQHLSAIDTILRNYGYEGSLIQAIEEADSSAHGENRYQPSSRQASKKSMLPSSPPQPAAAPPVQNASLLASNTI